MLLPDIIMFPFLEISEIPCLSWYIEGHAFSLFPSEIREEVIRELYDVTLCLPAGGTYRLPDSSSRHKALIHKENGMKKAFAVSFALMLLASSVFALNFSPSVLKITAPNTVQYMFNGATVEIPVTLTGANAASVLMVYTKGKAESIGTVRNGYLGWHYVNKVDTCLYQSDTKSFAKGSNSFVWDGKDQYGTVLAPGDYTYYVWGFDNTVPKKLSNHDGNGRMISVITHDANGVALSNPVEVYGGVKKWVIGSDPMDSNLIETTSLELPIEKAGMDGKIAFDATNPHVFWAEFTNFDTKVDALSKFDWVPNGTSTIDRTWGDNGSFMYPPVSAMWVGHGGLLNLKNEQLVMNRTSYHTGGSSAAELLFVDLGDGSLLKKIDLAPWWSSVDEYNAGGQMNGGPHIVDIMDHYVFLSSSISCHKHMLDPTRESDTDWFVWANDNGDFVGDHNFEESAAIKWVCNDWNVGPYMYTTAVDANLFSIFNAYDMGAVSFGLLGPDGTGVDYFAFAGETGGWKKGQYIIDSGSPFDGIYTDDEAPGGNHTAWDATKINPGSFFIPYDSFKGVISNQVGVADDAPVAFTVAQNSPNPFNPSTTITFTLAKAGKTTVEVYNIAGQKVSTLVNGSMSAGSHSVVWNAANVSAGVYFYTVKSGSFSKTMKMTLLK